ncbi:MAG TPA: VOC family protein [Polyangiales bacterium]|nr:VOC family protein [Polyangiales bacterium]
MFKKVAFTMFPVADAARARGFYEKTLGFKRGSASEDGVWTEYDLPGGGCLALFGGPQAKPSPGAGVSIAFEVEDLDALNKQLKTAGVKYQADMIPSPVCRMSIIQDTEGNSIILHELKKR